MEWRLICAGGQDNPRFHSGECKDLATVLPISGTFAAVFLALPALILLVRRARRR